MQFLGTLVIVHAGVADETAKNVYTVMFLPGAVPNMDVLTYVCRSDYALLRLLEEVLESPDVRLQALEQVRSDGRAEIPQLTLNEQTLAKYGFNLGQKAAPGRPRGREVPCVVCGRGITRRERAAIAQGELMHLQCGPQHDRTDDVARFLMTRAGRGFCQTCLTLLLRMDFEEIRKATTRLPARGDFRLVTGVCVACGMARVVVQHPLVAPNA